VALIEIDWRTPSTPREYAVSTYSQTKAVTLAPKIASNFDYLAEILKSCAR
jgi:hypothetical protein